MDIGQWLKFSGKVTSCRDAIRMDVVAIHQPMLKSTTRAGSLLWLMWFVSCVWLNKSNQRNQMNQTDEIDQIDCELPLGLALR